MWIKNSELHNFADDNTITCTSNTIQGRNKGKILGGAKELFLLFYYKNLHFWYRKCSDLLIIGGGGGTAPLKVP